MPHTPHPHSCFWATALIPFSVIPRNERGVARRTLLLTYANGQCQLSSAAKADLCLCLFLNSKMTNRLSELFWSNIKFLWGLGLLAMRCSDETAAVLCCNQRNEYTIPIVTLTCNHARDRQFRTTRTIQLATLLLQQDHKMIPISDEERQKWLFMA